LYGNFINYIVMGEENPSFWTCAQSFWHFEVNKICSIRNSVLERIRNLCSCSEYVFLTRSLVFERREHNTGTCTRINNTHHLSM
jgi:hypothetical protein